MRTFEPEPRHFYRHVASLALAVVALEPIAWWWKAPSAPLGVMVGVSALGLAVFLGPSLVLVWRRGFDTIQVGKKELVVSRKKGAFRLEWSAISGIRGRRGQIVFEKGSTHETFIVYLKGHEHHEQDLLTR